MLHTLEQQGVTGGWALFPHLDQGEYVGRGAERWVKDHDTYELARSQIGYSRPFPSLDRSRYENKRAIDTYVYVYVLMYPWAFKMCICCHTYAAGPRAKLFHLRHSRGG